MKKTHLAFLATLGLPAVTANAATVFSHTFDGIANDTTSPALQVFDNGNTHSDDIATGDLAGSGSGAVGFNTNASIDLSGIAGFTIEFVVENNISAVTGSPFNGTFFGITTSGSANDTGGTALYNNAGTASLPAIGLQLGNARGNPDTSEFAVDSGGSSFTGLGNPVDDGTAGYTISITYENAGGGTTDVSIVSTGLVTDYNFSTNVAFDYDTVYATATPNVSTQGGTLDLASITINTIPEPGSVMLSLAGLLVLAGRRRRA